MKKMEAEIIRNLIIFTWIYSWRRLWKKNLMTLIGIIRINNSFSNRMGLLKIKCHLLANVTFKSVLT